MNQAQSFKKDIQRHHGDYDEKLLNMLSSMTHKKHGKQVMIDLIEMMSIIFNIFIFL